MSKIIITTVGTSLIEKLGVPPHRDLKKGTHSKDWVSLSDDIGELRTAMSEKFIEKQNNTICAEIQSITKIQETYPDIAVYLICTDTILSPLCAEFIKQKLGDNVVETVIIKGLVVDGKDASKSFEDVGFPNLIEKIKGIEDSRKKKIQVDEQKERKKIDEQKLDNNKRNQEIGIAVQNSRKIEQETRAILNISGGYKALIPIMTIVGQIYEMEVNYIYEDSEDIIEIGNLPITFDWGIVEELFFFLDPKILHSPDFTNEVAFQKIILRLQNYKLINKRKEITALGKLFQQYVNDKMPDNKTTLGVLVEYKLLEYYHNDNQIRKAYFINRGVDMFEKGNQKKISDADLLWKHKTNRNEFIPFEVKSFYQIANDEIFEGQNRGKTVKSQFERQMDFIKKCWGVPTKVRYVVYQTSSGYNIGKFQAALQKNLNTLRDIVAKKFDNKVSFEVDILNIPLNENKNSYTEFLQENFKKNQFIENITL
jgi:CRISPR/Cas system-associated protein Csm6